MDDERSTLGHMFSFVSQVGDVKPKLLFEELTGRGEPRYYYDCLGDC